MSDCKSAEMRDQLPDVLHERLSAGARSAVLAHVGLCDECREELELLRGAQRALVLGTPRIDTSRIVSALPKPPSSGVVPIRPTRSRWADWRIAAAVTVLAAGGTSAALLMRSSGSSGQGADPRISPPVVAITNAPPAAAPTPELAPSPTAIPAKMNLAEVDSTITGEPGSLAGEDVTPEPEVEGRLTRLNEHQLRTLLNDIGQLKATPVTEPEPITIKVDPRSSSGSANDMEIL